MAESGTGTPRIEDARRRIRAKESLEHERKPNGFSGTPCKCGLESSNSAEVGHGCRRPWVQSRAESRPASLATGVHIQSASPIQKRAIDFDGQEVLPRVRKA